MLAYEFYWRDQLQKEHLVGILPERRRNPEEITEDSIMNWAWKVIGNNPNVNNTYFGSCRNIRDLKNKSIFNRKR